MKYVIVMLVYNEEGFIGCVIEFIVVQILILQYLVIVNDGFMDWICEIVEGYQ